MDRTGPIMLISLFLFFIVIFLFIPCRRLSWLSVSFLLQVTYTLSYLYHIIRGNCAWPIVCILCYVIICYFRRTIIWLAPQMQWPVVDEKLMIVIESSSEII